MNEINFCCADCGKEEGEGVLSLKACKSCMPVRYCNADCQRNHWPKHKKTCKERSAELHDEALFKDPPAKEDCPICFLPMPVMLIYCASLPSATLFSVPVYDYAIANEELANMSMKEYFTCCGKSICGGCVHSFIQSGNSEKCPFCKADLRGKTDEERVEEMMKRVEANDAGAMCVLSSYYDNGSGGLLQDREIAKELLIMAAELGYSHAHFKLGNRYADGGDLMNAKLYYEAAAMAGHEVARYNLGSIEGNSGNLDRAMKHWIIAASAGNHEAMNYLRDAFEDGLFSRGTIDSILSAYNNSCSKMRSEAREKFINNRIDHIGAR